MLHEQIKSELKEAMLAKDEVRLRTVRGLLSAFTNELVATKRRPDELLPDNDAMTVVRRSVKQRKDSIEQFEKGGRGDLADNERVELVILEKYLPKMMSREEIRPIAEAKKQQLDITDKSKAGILMGAVMKELSGKAEGTEVKAVIDELFS